MEGYSLFVVLSLLIRFRCLLRETGRAGFYLIRHKQMLTLRQMDLLIP
jgi:hypothetical protein